jgi:hypothetical protein
MDKHSSLLQKLRTKKFYNIGPPGLTFVGKTRDNPRGSSFTYSPGAGSWLYPKIG